MDKKTDALKLALEALVKTDAEPGSKAWEREVEAITAIREALSEQPAQQRHISYVCPQCHWSLDEQPAQQQEPVAWLVESKHGNWAPYLEWSEPSYLETQIVTPLYTSPPANANADKPWVGLTDEEIEDIEITWEATQEWACFRYAARAIETKLKEKNK